MKHYDVIIIGAGAAGLMCALTAGHRGRRVLVLERANKVGKKILMSGGGRCNFTNLTVGPDNYLCKNPHFCKSALNQFTQWDFIAMIERHGIAYHEREHGQLFCDESAKDVLAMLLDECEQVDVAIQVRCEITQIKLNDADIDQRFYVNSNQDDFTCQSLVVASGGLSIPTLGGSGFGYAIAEQFGLQVFPRSAGLVPLTLSGELKELAARLSGISVPVRISTLSAQGEHSFVEQLLFTHRGLSGPSVLQISSYWQVGNNVTIDLLPGQDAVELLKIMKQSQPKSVLRTALSAHLPRKLVKELESLWWLQWADKPLAEITDKVLMEIAGQLKVWSIKPAGTEGYRTAEVTIGGVDTDELSSKTMASKKQPGLFFIGEVVDVVGHLGGFNFQWAWSSAYVAGHSV